MSELAPFEERERRRVGVFHLYRLAMDQFTSDEALAENSARRTAARGDSNLYLRRNGHELTLTVEHRAVPSLLPSQLDLAQHCESLALQLRAAAKSDC